MHPQQNYQEYSQMYAQAMDPTMAWHTAAYAGLYRGYEAAAAAQHSEMWPSHHHHHMNSFIPNNEITPTDISAIENNAAASAAVFSQPPNTTGWYF